MIPPKRFRFTGLEGKRLGMFRLEMSSGSSGTLDVLTVDGVDLIGGAITYATSLANTAKLIADAINARTTTTGFWARTGIISSLSEVLVYQGTPGAITGAIVATATTLVVDVKQPASPGTDNVVYGDTDSWVDLPLAAPLAADDYAALYVVRVKSGLDKKVLRCAFVPAVAHLLWEKDTNNRSKPTLENQASSVVAPVGLPIPANVPFDLPVEDWFPGTTERILGPSAINGIFAPRYALLTR